MSKRAIKYISITTIWIFMVSVVVFYACHYYRTERSSLRSLYYTIFVSEKYVEPSPNGDYPENKTGKYQFDPQTIFSSLDQGKLDVFTPILDDSATIDVKYNGIAWTQDDFLRIANVLSQQVWAEPLDLNGWITYHIRFNGDCNAKFNGFNEFKLTYYKTIKTGWEMRYIARTITLKPIVGLALWGGDGEFSAPKLLGWSGIALTKFKITADEAVRIADENGGREARQGSDKCAVYVMPVETFYSNHGDDWHVQYSNTKPSFSIYINPFTGEVLSTK